VTLPAAPEAGADIDRPVITLTEGT